MVGRENKHLSNIFWCRVTSDFILSIFMHQFERVFNCKMFQNNEITKARKYWLRPKPQTIKLLLSDFPTKKQRKKLPTVFFCRKTRKICRKIRFFIVLGPSGLFRIPPFFFTRCPSSDDCTRPCSSAVLSLPKCPQSNRPSRSVWRTRAKAPRHLEKQN